MNFLEKVSVFVFSCCVFVACNSDEMVITDCEEFAVVREDISCNSFNFQSNTVNHNPEWYLYTHPDPDPVLIGTNSGLDFDPTEPGNYSIVAVYENPSCPEGTSVGFDVDVDASCFVDIDCEEFWVERSDISCNSFNFQSNAMSTNPEWYVIVHPDPDMIYLGNNSGLDFDPTEPGNYSIIAVYENENCPEGTTIGFDVDVYEDCFE